MILRPYQTKFVENCLFALNKFKNTIGIAPTGSGKSCIFSAIAGQYKSPLILQHRDELINQNINTYRKVNPTHKVDIFTADRKRFLSEGATFSMVPTLCRPDNLKKIKRHDLLVIDESHHAVAKSYRDIIQACKEANNDIDVIGLTATPSRGDRKALKEVFNNVGDIIQLSTMIQQGILVKPKAFVIDCGIKDKIEEAREYARVKRLSDFDMGMVEQIMDKEVINDKVFEEWKRLSGNRKTVAFCSTIIHAQSVCSVFVSKGIHAETIYGDMPDGERKAVLKRLDSGTTQVVFNVAVLVEGFDNQLISCVMLLRPCSYKSTAIQMIGRGLRRVDPERYPGITKDDCIILDFGYTLLQHGDLNVNVDLDPQQREKGEGEKKTCPECEMLVPAGVKTCPLCGFEFEEKEGGGDKESKGELKDFILTEVELLNLSPFRWESLFNDTVLIANALEACAFVVAYKGRFHSIGKTDYKKPTHIIGNSPDRMTALAVADDYLREWGDTDMAKKSRQWLSLSPTEKQCQLLGIPFNVFSAMTRYRASCALSWKFEERKIQQLLQSTK